MWQNTWKNQLREEVYMDSWLEDAAHHGRKIMTAGRTASVARKQRGASAEVLLTSSFLPVQDPIPWMATPTCGFLHQLPNLYFFIDIHRSLSPRWGWTISTINPEFWWWFLFLPRAYVPSAFHLYFKVQLVWGWASSALHSCIPDTLG